MRGFLAGTCLLLAGGLSAEKTTVAVLDLAATGVSRDLAIMATDFLRGELHNTGKFIIVERGQVDKVLGEQGFQQTGCTESDCAVEIGKLLNARWILIGTVGKIGTKVAISARIVDVENGSVLYSAKAKADSEEEIDTACTQLAAEFVARLEGRAPGGVTPQAAAPAGGLSREELAAIADAGGSVARYREWQILGVTVEQYVLLQKAGGRSRDYELLERHGADTAGYLKVLEYDLPVGDVVRLLVGGKSVDDARQAQIDGWKKDVARLKASRRGGWSWALAGTSVAAGGFSRLAYARHEAKYDEAESLRQEYLAATELAEIQRLRSETLAKADAGDSWYATSTVAFLGAVGVGAIATTVGIFRAIDVARLERLEEKLKKAGVKETALEPVPGGLRLAVRW
jgi:TolB-like protein